MEKHSLDQAVSDIKDILKFDYELNDVDVCGVAQELLRVSIEDVLNGKQ